MNEATANLHAVLQSVEDEFTPRGFVRSSKVGKTSWTGRLPREDGTERYCLISVVPQGRTTYSGETKTRVRVGYRLRVEVETAAKARVFFVRKALATSTLIRWIYRLRRQRVVRDAPPELDGFCAVAKDPTWAEHLLQEHDAIAATASLLQEDSSPTLAGSVYLSPSLIEPSLMEQMGSAQSRSRGTVYYASPILQLEQINPQRIDSVIARMQTLAIAAERLPESTIATEVTAIEAFSQRNPVMVGAAIVGGGLLLCLVVLGLMIGGVALLSR
ncbi:MAG: hypothetical protein K8J08_06665 [Thermoanaerobaculia bacterium]|nr:hypothetical protein [Thermoanaerobaculia bacterium]